MPAPLKADRTVMRDLHLRVLRLVADAAQAYGELGLRLEGGTALAAYHLRHRGSEGLDLFGTPVMDARDFARFLRERAPGGGLAVARAGPANRGFAELLMTEGGGAPGPPLRVQLGVRSPFSLAPPDATEEGVPVASYRDLCAGKLHAICDRFEPRDFVDLHAILHRPDPTTGALPGEKERRGRLRDLIADLQTVDPGLPLPRVGEAVARGLKPDLITGFPLRLLQPYTNAAVRATVDCCCDEIAVMVREAWEGPSRST
ncbi:MAG: nucleotidyl transferase AbiEii/AbiGii toxin family protein [Gemmatimonadetes bacterium]|nr:nucleotidyl transferase AbiEii/AbiGii toxin family protein [Gemmatimonadota bacterium]